MLVEIPPSISVSSFVGYLKGKSTLMIFERHENLKYKFGNRHFWCRGYYVDTVGKNEKKIQALLPADLNFETGENKKISLPQCVLSEIRISVDGSVTNSRYEFKARKADYE